MLSIQVPQCKGVFYSLRCFGYHCQFVIFPRMKILGVFSIFHFIHSFYILFLFTLSPCASSCVFLIKSEINHIAYHVICNKRRPFHLFLAYISYVLDLQCGVNFYQSENFESWILISCEEMIFWLLLSFKFNFFVLRSNPLENHLILF